MQTFELDPIRAPYLALLFPVPYGKGSDGRLYLEPRWAKDLREHTRYLHDLTVVSYLLPSPPPADWVAVDSVPELRRVRCIPVPYPRSTLHAVSLLPFMLKLLWRELGRAEIVHTGFSWPIGEAWMVTPLNVFRRKLHLTYVESANWRLVPGAPAGWKRKLQARMYEAINRFCCNTANLSFFTQEGYSQSLRTKRREGAHVIEASWIDAENIVEARAPRAPGQLKLAFAGRLTEAKGIRVLTEAVEGLDVELTVIGEGPGSVVRKGIRMLPSIPYGPAFLEELEKADVVVVPSLADEQPRVVFDAYSQGVPVLASDTPGLRQCVEDGVTGWLFPPGDVEALRSALVKLVADRAVIAEAAAACLVRARGLTHQEMHRRRWVILGHAIAGRQRTGSMPFVKSQTLHVRWHTELHIAASWTPTAAAHAVFARVTAPFSRSADALIPAPPSTAAAPSSSSGPWPAGCH